ncbi:MAG TPA: FadR/GntR family transcriptional regulator [Sphingomicrobium sp.]|nr:FadR/GntR family transcriptional regulator [Sphingomicrobium sp.]
MGKKLRKQSSESCVHRRVARDLAVAILGGKFEPGSRLGGELDLSKQLKVSRPAYREAIRILAAKGLLEIQPRTGTHIASRRHWNLMDVDVLAWMLEANPSDQWICDLFELRMMMEPAAAALAATRRTSRDLQRMGYELERMERSGLSTEEGQTADEEFHRMLLESAHNEPLTSLSTAITAAIRLTTSYKHAHGQSRDSIPEHRNLFDAVAEAHPNRARAAATELVQHAYEDMCMSLPISNEASAA